jgi:ligand-binding SRPBCC domain-containing protein
VTVVELKTSIEAPIDVCFRLSMSIDLELEAGKPHSLKVISGVTTGAIRLGERVGWQTRQFGLRVSHLSEITKLDPPTFFQDKMIRGVFQRFQHDHFFHAEGPKRTVMRDVLHFTMPPWLLGTLSERMLVRGRIVRLLAERNRLIKHRAESPSV